MRNLEKCPHCESGKYHTGADCYHCNGSSYSDSAIVKLCHEKPDFVALCNLYEAIKKDEIDIVINDNSLKFGYGFEEWSIEGLNKKLQYFASFAEAVQALLSQ
jgi:galactose-1-phosphate uridylyltransferase